MDERKRGKKGRKEEKEWKKEEGKGKNWRNNILILFNIGQYDRPKKSLQNNINQYGIKVWGGGHSGLFRGFSGG